MRTTITPQSAVSKSFTKFKEGFRVLANCMYLAKKVFLFMF